MNINPRRKLFPHAHPSTKVANFSDEEIEIRRQIEESERQIEELLNENEDQNPPFTPIQTVPDVLASPLFATVADPRGKLFV